MPDKIGKAMWDAKGRRGAVPRAPIRHGFLRGSWKGAGPDNRRPEFVEVEFGFYINYAWWVENMPYKHTTGQSHFLLSATNELRDGRKTTSPTNRSRRSRRPR